MENSTHKKKLTTREMEIAILIANVATTTEISKALSVKCNTVSSHKKKLYNKLGVKSSVALYKVLDGLGSLNKGL